jgi:hypothetical protein
VVRSILSGYVEDVNSDEERDGMSDLQLDWSTAEVSEGKLTVSLDDKPGGQWVASFERTATLLDHGTWPEITLKKRQIIVKQVEPGTEERLRFFLESVIQEANAEQGSDQEEDSADEPEEDEAPEGEDSQAEDDPDTEMTDRFQSFAGGGEGASSS